jgi:hypothetical protein
MSAHIRSASDGCTCSFALAAGERKSKLARHYGISRETVRSYLKQVRSA